MSSKIVYISLFVLLLSISCASDKKELVWSEYSAWMQDHIDQLQKEKVINGIELSSFYQPADYLAYRDIQNSNKSIDSTSYKMSLSNYQCGMTFKITLKTDVKGLNLLYHQIDSEQAYKERVNKLHFHADQFISMTIGKNIYAPILANYEGYNELNNQLVFTVVFDADEFDCGELSPEIENIKITFDDPYWSMGVNHFSYKRSIISEIPSLVLG